MYKCDKCNIKINAINDRCPLCKNKTKIVKKSENIYPTIPSLYSNANVTFNVLTFISIIGVVISVIINYLLNKEISWANFVILGTTSFWLIILFSFKKGQVFVKKLINYYILFVILLLGWDVFINFSKWSVNYAIPILTNIYLLFIFIMGIFNRKTIKEYVLQIYISLIIGFTPLVAYYLGWLSIYLPSYIATIFNIVVIIFITIFYFNILRKEFKKKLHF